MHKKNRQWRFPFLAIIMNLQEFMRSVFFKSVNIIPLSIFFAKLLEIQSSLLSSDSTNLFATNFISWFSVIYGVLLPLILIKVWNQLDRIDREFDKEANALKLLYEYLFYLRGKNAKYGREIAYLLRKYLTHVLEYYRFEIKSIGNKTGTDDIKLQGDLILEKIREQCKALVLSDANIAKGPSLFVLQILDKLNNVVDIRESRIALASQRFFESLRFIALITSILFITPFYFVGFTQTSSLLENLLTVGATLLVIFIYMIIEDFDEPFGGAWIVSNESWKQVLGHIDNHESKTELRNSGKLNNRKKITRRGTF